MLLQNSIKALPVNFKIQVKIFGTSEIYILLCISKYFCNMETNSKSVEDIKTIRKIMEESSRFLSLSGLSGVFAGVFAIAGAVVAFFLIRNYEANHLASIFKSLSGNPSFPLKWKLIADAVVVLILSVASALYFSNRKAKSDGKSSWTPVSKRLLINLLIPLTSGGLFIIILLTQKQTTLIVPGMLIFYGLALVNGGKFTYGEVFYLGILQIITGLVAALYPQQALGFWVFGFGILHILYGMVMYRKYGA